MRKTASVWTTSIAAVAFVALPMIAAAQTYPPAGQTTPQQNPSQMSSADQNSPQFHLDEAKRILDSISTSDLTGTALTQISQIKTRFTDLYNNYKSTPGSASPGAQAGTAGTTGTTGTTVPQSGSTAATDWKTQFNMLERDLDRLNIPKSSYAPSTTGAATGTTGATGATGGAVSGGMSGQASVNLPSEIRDKLTDFRTHLEQFYSLAQVQR